LHCTSTHSAILSYQCLNDWQDSRCYATKALPAQAKQSKPTTVVVKNEMIRSEHVILIDEKGKQVGEMRRQDALQRARKAQLDLVLVNPNNGLPICRIMRSYQRKEVAPSTQEASEDYKEIRFSPRVEEHDVQTKVEL